MEKQIEDPNCWKINIGWVDGEISQEITILNAALRFDRTRSILKMILEIVESPIPGPYPLNQIHIECSDIIIMKQLLLDLARKQPGCRIIEHELIPVNDWGFNIRIKEGAIPFTFIE